MIIFSRMLSKAFLILIEATKCTPRMTRLQTRVRTKGQQDPFVLLEDLFNINVIHFPAAEAQTDCFGLCCFSDVRSEPNLWSSSNSEGMRSRLRGTFLLVTLWPHSHLQLSDAMRWAMTRYIALLYFSYEVFRLNAKKRSGARRIRAIGRWDFSRHISSFLSAAICHNSN